MKAPFIIAGALLALALGIEHRRGAETAQTKADAASMTAAKEMADAKAEIYALRFLLVDSDPGFKSDMIGCRVMSTIGATRLTEDIIRMTEDCRRRVANDRAVAKASAMRAEDELPPVMKYRGGDADARAWLPDEARTRLALGAAAGREKKDQGQEVFASHAAQGVGGWARGQGARVSRHVSYWSAQ